MRTCMDKAESMHLEACIPDSWWEFSVEYAVHCYNRTPVRRLNWHTPYEAMNAEIPDISHLRVFGCGAYVYLPQEVRTNKLSPKSELMVYIGIAEGIKGNRFMRITNNQVFTAATALFDESLFPKCKTAIKRPTTRLYEPVDQQPPITPRLTLDDDDDDLPFRSTRRFTPKNIPPPQSPKFQEVS